MPYKWLMFDADGTLFDYNQAETHALRRTFEQFGYTFQPAYSAAYREINRQIWLDFERGEVDQVTLRTRRFENLFEAVEVQLDASAFSARYLANLSNRTDLIEGAETLVQTVAKTHNLAIITNGLADVQWPRFKQSTIYPCFQTVIISEDVGAAKPDPQIFDAAFAHMNHPARSEVLIIGDSLTSDIQGGINYGIDTCWLNIDGKTNGNLSPTYEINKLAHLSRLLAA